MLFISLRAAKSSRNTLCFTPCAQFEDLSIAPNPPSRPLPLSRTLSPCSGVGSGPFHSSCAVRARDFHIAASFPVLMHAALQAALGSVVSQLSTSVLAARSISWLPINHLAFGFFDANYNKHYFHYSYILIIYVHTYINHSFCVSILFYCVIPFFFFFLVCFFAAWYLVIEFCYRGMNEGECVGSIG